MRCALVIARILALAGCGRIGFEPFDPTSDALSETVRDRCLRSAGLVAYWPFNEASGVVIEDVSPQAQTATLVGSSAWITGAIGPAVSFDGPNDFVVLSSTSGLDFGGGTGSFSFSYWVNPRELKANDARSFEIAYCTGVAYFFTEIIQPGIALLVAYDDVNNTSSTASAAGSIVIDRWTHVVHVVDRQTNKAHTFIDGIASGSEADIAALTGIIDCSGVTISSFGGWDGFFQFRGAVDDARIFNRVLSSGEVAQLAALTTTDCPF